MPTVPFDLVDLFESLRSFPETLGDNSAFAGRLIPGKEYIYLARDQKGHPALLIAVQFERANITPPIIELEHIAVHHGLECRLYQPDGTVSTGVFSIVKCIHSNHMLREYFLRSVAPVIYGLSVRPTQAEIVQAINTLVELFRVMSQPSRKSIQGLWAELLLIAESTDPSVLIECWHKAPEDLYDFNGGSSRIEVKSTDGSVRAHYFSFEQLHPPKGTRVLVASMLVKPASGGVSIIDLTNEISAHVSTDPHILERLVTGIGLSLGSTWRQALDHRFDREYAVESLKFFDCASIPSIPLPLPAGVDHVTFRSDMSTATPLDINDTLSDSVLFGALMKK